MQRFIEHHTDEHFDLIVVDGGITGALRRSEGIHIITANHHLTGCEIPDLNAFLYAKTSALVKGDRGRR